MSTAKTPIDPAKVVWCLHCERAYQNDEYRRLDGLRMCPYGDCDGDAVVDQWEWSHVRDNNPGYPARPERGVVYLLHGPDYQHPSEKRQTRT